MTAILDFAAVLSEIGWERLFAIDQDAKLPEHGFQLH